MVRSLGTEPTFDLEPLFKAVGVEQVVDQIGLERVIAQFGWDRVLQVIKPEQIDPLMEKLLAIKQRSMRPPQ